MKAVISAITEDKKNPILIVGDSCIIGGQVTIFTGKIIEEDGFICMGNIVTKNVSTPK